MWDTLVFVVVWVLVIPFYVHLLRKRKITWLMLAGVLLVGFGGTWMLLTAGQSVHRMDTSGVGIFLLGAILQAMDQWKRR